MSAAWSRDGRHIVTASEDTTARVWDAENGSLLAVLAGSSHPAQSVAWHPDGTSILTNHDEDVPRVWKYLPETRKADEIAAQMACFSPMRFQPPTSSAVAISAPSADPGNRAACTALRRPAARTAHWSERMDSLLAGIRAVRARQMEVAKELFIEARSIQTKLNDSTGLAITATTEAVLLSNSGPQAGQLEAAVQEIRKGHVDLAKQANAFQELADFADEQLSSQPTVIWALEQQLHVPVQNAEQLAVAQMNRVLLGRFDEALTQAEAALARKQLPSTRSVFPLFSWIAAFVKKDVKAQARWAGRTLTEYSALADQETAGQWMDFCERMLVRLRVPDKKLLHIRSLASLLFTAKDAESVKLMEALLKTYPQ